MVVVAILKFMFLCNNNLLVINKKKGEKILCDVQFSFSKGVTFNKIMQSLTISFKCNRWGFLFYIKLGKTKLITKAQQLTLDVSETLLVYMFYR